MDISNENLTSTPAVAYGLVYVGCSIVSTYCLNATNGLPVWSNFTTPYVYGQAHTSCAAWNGMVFTGSVNGHLCCWNATTGAPIWSYTTGDEEQMFGL